MIRTILIILLLLPFIGYADMYSWTDENGVKHFSNTPPEKKTGAVHQTEEFVGPDKKELEPPEKKLDGIKAAVNPSQKEETKTSRSNERKITGEVVMYTTPTCGYCLRAKAFFIKHGVSYTEYDIKASEQAREKFKSLNGRGVPLIFIGDKRISGFNKPAIKIALGIQ